MKNAMNDKNHFTSSEMHPRKWHPRMGTNSGLRIGATYTEVIIIKKAPDYSGACAPTEIRTPVLALKGLRPSPLDDGGELRDFTTAIPMGQG